jgi:hypothetical protein
MVPLPLTVRPKGVEVPHPRAGKREDRTLRRAPPMPRAKGAATVLHVQGPVVLDWGNGMRIQLSPVGAMGAAPIASAPSRKGAGRPPSAATLALREAMVKDAKAGHPRGRADYLALLKGAGGPASPNAAGIIVNREAKRAFGHPLGRGKGASKGARKGARRGGRQASPATAALRARLAEDAAKGALRDAPFYVRWVIDQPGVKLGLKGARPIVYRELRAARA